jgi:DnaJ-class molecular chaperone
MVLLHAVKIFLFKVVQEKKVLEVHFEKGMQHNQKITFLGEADEAVCLFKHQCDKM